MIPPRQTMLIRPPRLRRGLPRPRYDNQQPDNQQPDDQQEDDQFYPDIYDVLKVRHILLWRVKSEGLPTEVVDMIVDAAEYWPSVESKLGEKRTIRKDMDEALLCTSPLCYDAKSLETSVPKILPHRTVHPCRKIVFWIVSHDQGGFESRGRPATYDGSFTWFDAEVIRNAHEPSQQEIVREKMHPAEKTPKHFGPNDPLLLPRGNKLQSNCARIQPAKRRTIVWHYLDNVPVGSSEAEEIERSEGRGQATLDGKQVREMELGDSILVWARARFPGWINYVNELSIRVFWAV